MEAERKRQQPSTREQDDIPRVLQGNWDWILDWREKPSESTLGDANFVKRREGETPSCVDSLARVESKSERHRQGEKERERDHEREGRDMIDKRQILRSPCYRSSFHRSANIRGAAFLVFARNIFVFLRSFSSIRSLSHFYVDCTKSSEEKKSELNFRSLLAGRNNEVRNRKKERKKEKKRLTSENRAKGRVNVPPAETKFRPFGFSHESLLSRSALRIHSASNVHRRATTFLSSVKL